MKDNALKTCLAIPARKDSVRLPNKLLLSIGKKTILEHTIARALRCKFFDEMWIVTDDVHIANIGETYGLKVKLSPAVCENGTERIAQLLSVSEADVFVNLQADEVGITPQTIKKVLHTCLGGAQMASAMYQLTSWRDIHDPNIVKVCCNHQNNALYFSRSVIPHCDAQKDIPLIYGHIGIYAYQRDVLQTIAQHPPCFIEQQERLEQLRALYLGYSISMLESEQSISINTAEDLEHFRQIFNSR